MSLEQNTWDNETLVRILQNGGVAVIPTDTIYGIVGKASYPDTVERIYKARKRAPDKPCIILIGDINDINKFSITLSENQKKGLQDYWAKEDRPTSIVFDCLDEKFAYLHRGTNTLAFRLPKKEGLRNLLLKAGPLIAPSANSEGLPPSKNIGDAKNYFGKNIDIYIDAGEIESEASKVIRLEEDGKITVLRS